MSHALIKKSKIKKFLLRDAKKGCWFSIVNVIDDQTRRIIDEGNFIAVYKTQEGSPVCCYFIDTKSRLNHIRVKETQKPMDLLDLIEVSRLENDLIIRN